MSRTTSVPKAMLPTYEALVALTDPFCTERLDGEYRDLARAMIAALCRKRPSPLLSGKAHSWACAVICTLGQLNFLTDRSIQPYMATADLCAAFGVGQSTVHAKAKLIRDKLDAHRFDMTWTLPALARRNPLVWLVQVDGLLTDIRHMPREVQVAALEQGIIPFLPE